jgi:transposase
MAARLVPDDLWAAISPLLPPEPPKPKGGRPRVPDRLALAGILFVLRTGIQWRDAPAEMGCSGKTCWRRLVEWHEAGGWRALHRALLEQLRNADRLDWSR